MDLQLITVWWCARQGEEAATFAAISAAGQHLCRNLHNSTASFPQVFKFLTGVKINNCRVLGHAQLLERVKADRIDFFLESKSYSVANTEPGNRKF